MRPSTVLLCLLWSLPASAQTETPPPSLKIPTIVFASALSADLLTTYVGLSSGGELHEHNVITRALRDRPFATVAVAAAIDGAALWAWNRYVGRRHPKLAVAGLSIGAAVEAGLAVSNAALIRRVH